MGHATLLQTKSERKTRKLPMLSLVQILSVLELGVTPLQKKEYFEHIIIILEMPAQVSHVREQWFKT